MHPQYDIRFTASESSSKLTAGKVCYQGQIIHNQTLDVDETRKRFADYMRQSEPMANLAIDSVCGFIAQELARGNRIDFGPFSAGLKMRGGLPAANAPFDPSANALTIELTPGKKLKEALRGLRPVNVTALGRTKITQSIQETPCKLQDAICPTGVRRLSVYGSNVLIHPEGVGEGVAIENDAGEKLLAGEYIDGDAFHVRVRLTGDIPPGLYWLALSSRMQGETELRRAQRRITVIEETP